MHPNIKCFGICLKCILQNLMWRETASRVRREVSKKACCSAILLCWELSGQFLFSKILETMYILNSKIWRAQICDKLNVLTDLAECLDWIWSKHFPAKYLRKCKISMNVELVKICFMLCFSFCQKKRRKKLIVLLKEYTSQILGAGLKAERGFGFPTPLDFSPNYLL